MPRSRNHIHLVFSGLSGPQHFRHGLTEFILAYGSPPTLIVWLGSAIWHDMHELLDQSDRSCFIRLRRVDICEQATCHTTKSTKLDFVCSHALYKIINIYTSSYMYMIIILLLCWMRIILNSFCSVLCIYYKLRMTMMICASERHTAKVSRDEHRLLHSSEKRLILDRLASLKIMWQTFFVFNLPKNKLFWNGMRWMLDAYSPYLYYY